MAISTAIPEHNPEFAANERRIPVLRRGDILPAISAERRSIVVAGTHGKTTTSSMLAMAMVEADLDPSFIIGGDVNEIGSGAVWADGEWFIIEMSPIARSSLGAEIIIVTNVEPDHLETYDNDPEQLLAAFVQFADAATTPIYWTMPGRCRCERGAGLTYGTAGTPTTAWSTSRRAGVGDLPNPARWGGDGPRRVADPGHATQRSSRLRGDGRRRWFGRRNCAALARFGGVARRFEFEARSTG